MGQPTAWRSRPALSRVATLALLVLSALVVCVAAARRGARAARGAPSTRAAAARPPHPTAAPDGSALAAVGELDAGVGGGAAASCSIPKQPGGRYGPWRRLPIGRMMVPQPPPTDDYDLLVHFHGGEGARKLLAPRNLGLVIATVDAGTGSKAYQSIFTGSEPLMELLGTVGAALAPARLRYLIISSWSAGYGAVREILREHPTAPSALVLLDSVHVAYRESGEELVTEDLKPFLSFARRAAAGEAVMVLTHSEIKPPGYASTSEVASTLIAELGGRRRYGGLLPTHGVQLKTRFDEGGLHIRGYTGAGKPAHCAELSLLGDIVANEVLPALATP